MVFNYEVGVELLQDEESVGYTDRSVKETAAECAFRRRVVVDETGQ